MYINEDYEWWSPLLKKMFNDGQHKLYTHVDGKQICIQKATPTQIMYFIEQYPGGALVEKWSSWQGWTYTYYLKSGYSINFYVLPNRYESLVPSPAPQYTFKPWNGKTN